MGNRLCSEGDGDKGAATISDAPTSSAPAANGKPVMNGKVVADRRVQQRQNEQAQQRSAAGASASAGVYGRSRTIDYDALEKESQRENFEQMKENYFKNPSLFLTNLLLMSVQFFKNYDR